MGGGGGGGGGFQPYYQAYSYAPDDYRGQNEINQASAANNANSVRTINSRIIPNMRNIDYYRLINRLHLEAIETTNQQTEAFVEKYPQHILAKIITLEEAYQRINDYIQFFATFDKNDFKLKLGSHRQWFAKTAGELCSLKDRADYYRRRLTIKKQIETAIIGKRTEYLNIKMKSDSPTEIPFELNLPADLTHDDTFKISYVNELEDDPEPYRLYISLPPPQTGNV